MPEVIISGPAGRIEAKYQAGKTGTDRVALILHPHPLDGGTMHNKVTYALYKAFLKNDFNTVRFNFRGVGKSEGIFDNGEGELSDAAAVLDWLQTKHPNAHRFWVGGFSFGGWIAMQLLMRRPELEGFVVVSPPANKYDFNFLAPCPVSGLIIQGTQDEIVPVHTVENLAYKLKKQKGINIDLKIIQGASHLFHNHIPDVLGVSETYLKNQI